MTLARHIFSDLVEKRLWPVALALAIALIAIPVGLSKSPSQHAATGRTGNSPLAGEWSKLLGETAPVVSLAAENSTPTYRKRLARLRSKNPFIQQAIVKATTQGSGSSGSTSSTSGTGGSVPPPVAPVSLPNTTPTSPSTGTGSQPSQPQQFNYTATVSFGLEGKTSKKTLLPTDPLPNADSPIVVFMGASDGGKKAVFVVFAGASPRGVGECKPSADKCNFLYLKKDDVELFDVTATDGSVTTYELALEKIGVKTVSSSASHASKTDGRPHSSAGKLVASPAR
jgi:hypothetical protein